VVVISSQILDRLDSFSRRRRPTRQSVLMVYCRLTGSSRRGSASWTDSSSRPGLETCFCL